MLKNKILLEKIWYTKRRFQVVEMAVCKAPVDQSVGIQKGGIPNIRHSAKWASKQKHVSTSL